MRPAELLTRQPCLSIPPVPKERYAGKTALVTGAAGSIGNVLYRALVDLGAKVHGIDHSEHAVALLPHLGLCRYQDFEEYENYDFIFHAAAYKHVILGEKNPDRFLENNGEDVHRLLARFWSMQKHPNFVFVSTDKAAGESVLGQSKRRGEEACEIHNDFARSLRLVNCAFSHGSVLDLWSKGVKRLVIDGCTRYWMQMDEAARALLWMPFIPGGSYSIFGAPTFSIQELAIVWGGEFEAIPRGPGEVLDEKLIREDETLEETEHAWLRKIRK